MEKLELTMQELGLIELALQNEVDRLNHRFDELDETKYEHPAKKYEALVCKITRWNDALPSCSYTVIPKVG